MALAKQFSNKLDKLWQRRTANLRSVVIPRGVGKPPTFSRQVRERLINDLLETASEILVKRDAPWEFNEVKRTRHLKHIDGRGLTQRGTNLLRWAAAKLNGPIVYVFWKSKKCLYVGKGTSWRRLKSYEKSAYLLQATCIEVFSIKTQGRLGKAECLATHLYEPRDQKVKPAKVKWGKCCPVCRKHDLVRQQLQTLFRMK